MIVEHADGQEKRGSGYRVSSGTVLTSGHVVAGARRIQVRFHTAEQDRTVEAEAAWACDEPGADLAVLRFTPPETAARVDDVRFARVCESDPAFDVRTAGFPRWKLHAGEGEATYRDVVDAQGRISPASNWISGTLEVRLDNTPPDYRESDLDEGEPTPNPWGGMSGAAVWAGGHIIAVVRETHPRWGRGMLDAVRIDKALGRRADAAGPTFGEVLGIDAATLPFAGQEQPVAHTVQRPADVPERELDTYLVSVTARPTGRWPGCPPLDERFRARLDVHVCLRRGALTAVLADEDDPWLAAALNAVERIIPAPRPRSWWALDVARRTPPRSHAELAAMLADDTGWADRGDRDVGFVLQWHDFHEPASALGFRTGLCRLVPDAALVYQVTAARWSDATDTAAEVALRLGLSEFMVRPPALTVPRNLGRAPGAGVDRAAAGLLQLLRADADPGAFGPSDGDPLPADADAARTARQIVRELNDAPVWGGDERTVLEAVRDLQPALYPALIAEYARHREDPIRLDSLRTVARTDREIDIWIDAARMRLPLPTARGPERELGTDVVDALVLGLLRQGLADAAGQWAPEAGLVVRRIAAFHAEGDQRDEPGFFSGATADEAVAAVRAGLGGTVSLPRIRRAQAKPGCWALLARRRLSEEEAKWLHTLPRQFHQMVGLAPGTLSAVELHDYAPQRRAYLPLPPA